MLPNKRLHCDSHFEGGKSQRREIDVSSSKPIGGDARSGKVVFKLASLSEIEPYGNLIVATNRQCPARRESAY